jgi:hypothetical protein
MSFGGIGIEKLMKDGFRLDLSRPSSMDFLTAIISSTHFW